jgi:hypothetical protein
MVGNKSGKKNTNVVENPQQLGAQAGGVHLEYVWRLTELPDELLSCIDVGFLQFVHGDLPYTGNILDFAISQGLGLEELKLFGGGKSGHGMESQQKLWGIRGSRAKGKRCPSCGASTEVFQKNGTPGGRPLDFAGRLLYEALVEHTSYYKRNKQIALQSELFAATWKPCSRSSKNTRITLP